MTMFYRGLNPVYSLTGNSHSFPTETYQAAEDVALYKGQVVQLVNGLVTPCSNSDAAELPLGVIAGIFYPRANGRPVDTDEVTAAENSVPVSGHFHGIDFAGTVANPVGVGVRVWVDPNLVYNVKATEAIVQADIGDLVQLVTNATDASVTHTATVGPFAATAATAGGVLKIIDVPRFNTPGTPAITDITTDTGLVNKFGTDDTVVSVVFNQCEYRNSNTLAIQAALALKADA